MNPQGTANIIIDTDQDGNAELVEAEVYYRSGRPWAWLNGVWYMPGSFTVPSDAQAEQMREAEERAQ